MELGATARAGGAGRAVRSLDETGPEFLDEIKAYLDCRSRGVDPPPSLAEAWEGFYGVYAPRIRTFLKKWDLSEADRSDCLQEVWHEVVAQLARFGHDPGRARLSTWLLTLARNKAVDAIRRRRRHAFESLGEGESTTAMDPGLDPAAAYERRQTQAQVRGALAQLSSQVSPKSYQVLYLRWIEGRPTAEVAAALALTPGQVRFRTCRMKRKVRDLLERSMERERLGDEAGRPREEGPGRLRNNSTLHGE
jgi:RNA polymerase sigma-70 factor (ECF subfamily)